MSMESWIVLGLVLLIVVLWRVSQAVLAVCDALLKIDGRLESLGHLGWLDNLSEIADTLRDWKGKGESGKENLA